MQLTLDFAILKQRLWTRGASFSGSTYHCILRIPDHPGFIKGLQPKVRAMQEAWNVTFSAVLQHSAYKGKLSFA